MEYSSVFSKNPFAYLIRRMGRAQRTPSKAVPREMPVMGFAALCPSYESSGRLILSGRGPAL
jgi:hypothetical protein